MRLRPVRRGCAVVTDAGEDAVICGGRCSIAPPPPARTRACSVAEPPNSRPNLLHFAPAFINTRRILAISAGYSRRRRADLVTRHVLSLTGVRRSLPHLLIN